MQEISRQPVTSLLSATKTGGNAGKSADENVLLVIDDELGPRESVRMLFKDTHRVLTASSGDEGIRIIADTPVDLVILDLKMQGKDGIETLEEIRKINETVPVIILTGYGTMEAAKKAIHFGAIEFLTKPFDVEDLAKIVKLAIEKSRFRMHSELLTNKLMDFNSQLQKKVEEMENLATLGQLSAEILHEINNPLTVIQGYTQLLLQELAAQQNQIPPDRQKYLIAIDEEIKRCQTITRNILNISRQKSESREVELNGIIQKIIDFLQTSNIGKNVSFTLSLEENLPPVKGDGNQLHQAFVNFVINGIQAITPESDGSISIATRRMDKQVCVSFTDNGVGIPDEVLPHIFTPFFSTKKAGGTGLGLSITHKIIQKHGGDIKVESAIGKGTTFHVSLPAVIKI